MRKKLTGLIVGTLMLTLIGGTAAFAAETGGTSAGAAGQDKQTVAIEDAVKTALEDAKVAEGDAAGRGEPLRERFEKGHGGLLLELGDAGHGLFDAVAVVERGDADEALAAAAEV